MGSCVQREVCEPSSACQRTAPFFAAKAVTVPAAVAVMYSPPLGSAMKSGWAVTTRVERPDQASASFGAVAAWMVLRVATPFRRFEFPQVDQSPRGAAA